MYIYSINVLGILLHYINSKLHISYHLLKNYQKEKVKVL